MIPLSVMAKPKPLPVPDEGKTVSSEKIKNVTEPKDKDTLQSVKESQECKAKDPANCPHHGTGKFSVVAKSSANAVVK